MTHPRKPTRAQAAAEKRLREMDVTMTMQPHGLHPHRTPTPGCFTCSMLASMERVNGCECSACGGAEAWDDNEADS